LFDVDLYEKNEKKKEVNKDHMAILHISKKNEEGVYHSKQYEIVKKNNRTFNDNILKTQGIKRNEKRQVHIRT